MVAPENVHYNTHEEILNARSQTLEKAWQLHPERLPGIFLLFRAVRCGAWASLFNVSEIRTGVDFFLAMVSNNETKLGGIAKKIESPP